MIDLYKNMDDSIGNVSAESENEGNETTSPKTEKSTRGSAFFGDLGDDSPAAHLAIGTVSGEQAGLVGSMNEPQATN